jgi:hypothetical protein
VNNAELLAFGGQPCEEYLTAAEINQLRNGVNELYENVSNSGTKNGVVLCQVECQVTVTSGSHIQYVMATNSNGFVGVSGVHSKIDKMWGEYMEGPGF